MRGDQSCGRFTGFNRTLKALLLVKRGTWVVREAPTPRPKSDEVRIKVRTSGLNFAELMASQGVLP